ncbi:hypothetical protein MCOR27_003309 [Pyricularia oryzae]|uniref:Nuclear membrane fusion protein Kar5 n=1 Tax=Pyricularia grisea TaxID=148305 RepID=A0ABQ8N6C4_PYRGI|nr:hypothetical protein MCOR01_002912 [Pyricularia oryzae]KAI6292028.1 hypothetical protein MCOR33_010153 [Pyricularia grisea]KAH9432829.1 hypothetical protein MCOR02_007507 [Pyricularia oryzae]KAI6254087.1 hypothetical protein MCOR19_009386 [Pyricularia oryzae]KAI6276512.1 hypothetical protein MCOR26_005600 [Pyricularia oryzae]
MHLPTSLGALHFLMVLWFSPHSIAALGWGNRAKSSPPQRSREAATFHTDAYDPTFVIQPAVLVDVYADALRQLQQLESEPLCHRIAARLLVTNCQLLDGKDEATVLTDSGRLIRDFVEAYAASLAICDLERGDFHIPSACSPFREHALAKVSAHRDLSLHVSSSQIQACISGLKSPDSAWGTYISYRHKALQFCEAARADQEKTQNILVFQKLIKVTEQLVTGVETELQKRMNDLDERTKQASDAIDRLNPKLHGLHESFGKVQIMQNGLSEALRDSLGATRSVLEDSTTLQQLLKVMIDAVLQHHSEVASANEQSVESYAAVTAASQRTSEEMVQVLSALSIAATYTVELNQKLQLSRVEAAELSKRQNLMANGLVRLENITEQLVEKYGKHSAKLESVRNITNDIVETLNDAHILATAAKNTFTFGSSGWLPNFGSICIPGP